MRFILTVVAASTILLCAVAQQLSGSHGENIPSATDAANLPGSGYYELGTGIAAPRLVYAPDPECTPDVKGRISFLIGIGSDGRVMESRFVSWRPSQGGRAIARESIQAVEETIRKWRFEPARKDGRAVPVRVRVETPINLPR